MAIQTTNITLDGLVHTLDDRDRVAAQLVAENANTFTNFNTFSAGKGFANGEADISGLTATTITTNTTAAVNTHSVQKGAYINCATDAVTVTLPAVVIGASFIIVNSAADGGALLTVSPNGSDKFLVDIAGAAGTDDKDIVNTKATQRQYDFVHLIGVHADGWLIHNIRGTWVDQS